MRLRHAPHLTSSVSYIEVSYKSLCEMCAALRPPPPPRCHVPPPPPRTPSLCAQPPPPLQPPHPALQLYATDSTRALSNERLKRMLLRRTHTQ